MSLANCVLFIVVNIFSEKKLHDYTDASVKHMEPGIQKLAISYNNLCIQMKALIHQKKAPEGSVASLPIPKDGLFKLDVDDDIWEDVGLGNSIGSLLSSPGLLWVKVQMNSRSRG